MAELNLRPATPADHAVIVRFNRALALETKAKRLDPDTLARGVAAVLADPAKGFYTVAEVAGAAVGQVLITAEYSDWRAGWFWWLQSVYVEPGSRRQGVFRALHLHVVELAHAAGDVIGLRLYVERDNANAQATYARLGFAPEGYDLHALAPLPGVAGRL